MAISILASTQKRTLANGLTVLVNEDFTTPVVSCHAFVRVGSNYESDEVWGWSHGIEHMLFKGTATRGVGDIAREVRELGGVLNASTGYDVTSYYITTPVAGFEHAVSLHADGIRNSAFRQEDLDAERQVLTEELKMYQDVPDGFGVAWDELMKVAFTRHRYRRSLIGTEETLRDTPRDAIVDYWRRGYVPRNMIYVVAGAVGADDAFATVERHFGDMSSDAPPLTRPEPEPRQTDFRFVEMRGEVEQAYIKIGFHVPDDDHPDAAAVQVLSHLLGSGRSSRLYRELLERGGLVDSVSVVEEAGVDPGILLIDASTDADPQRARTAAAAIYREIAWFHENLVTAEALEKSFNSVVVAFVSGLETVEGQSSIAGRFEAFGDYRRAAAYPARIAAVTADDVRRVAREYLRFDGSTLLFYLPGPKGPASREGEAEMRAWLEDELGDAAVATDPSPAFDPSARAGAVDATPKPAPTTAARPAGAGEIRLGRLANGSELLVRPMKKVPLVALAVYGQAGSRYEPDDLVGIGTLCSRSMLKGTTSRTNDAIADELDQFGISLVPFNDRDVIGFYLECLTSELGRGLDLLADVVQHAAYPEAEVQRERELQLSDLAMEQDDTFTVTMRRFSETLMNGHPYGRNSLGTAETIAAVRREDLLAWHRRFFVPRNLSVVAIGDVEIDPILSALDARFGHLTPGERPTPPPRLFSPAHTPEPIVIHRDKAQSVIVTGVPAPHRRDETRYAHVVLQRILDGMGERLFTAIREQRQLCYFTGAFFSPLDDAGIFGAYVGTSADRVNEALEVLWEELEKIRDEGPTDAELERAKRVITGSYLIMFQRSGTQASSFARNLALGFGHERVLQYPDRIRAVTRDEVVAAARATLDRRRAVTVLLRPEEDA